MGCTKTLAPVDIAYCAHHLYARFKREIQTASIVGSIVVLMGRSELPVVSTALEILAIYCRDARFFILIGIGGEVAFTLLDLVSVAVTSHYHDHVIAGRPSQGELETLVWIAATLVSLLLMMVGQMLLATVCVMRTYDLLGGQSVDLRDYGRAALQHVAPLFVTTTITGIVILCGFALMIVPGLWLGCMYALVVPAVIVDRARYDALDRSRRLTKGFRWSVLGIGVLVFGATLPVTVLEFWLGRSPLLAIAKLAFEAMTLAVPPIASAVIHMRLRFIKEGSAGAA